MLSSSGTSHTGGYLYAYLCSRPGNLRHRRHQRGDHSARQQLKRLEKYRDLPDRTKILDLHYIIQSRCPFTGKYPTAGSHYSVNRLVHSGNRFQPYPRNHPASIYKFRSSCDAGYSDLAGRNAVNDSRHSALARRNAVRSPRQVALVRRKTVQLYRAGYGFRCTCDSGYSDPARTNSTCNSGETAPVGTKAVQLY